MFEFVRREKANHDLRRMCRLLGVSASGYYAWTRRPLCPRKKEDAGLRDLIVAIHRRSRETYGMPRILDELRYDHGVRCSGKRVRRLMRQLGIKGSLWGPYSGICSSCGAKGIPAEFAFCGKCGASLEKIPAGAAAGASDGR
ncbi:MAG TPA: IS3 family transposase [Candidatus Dormibacteraeota bacterium]